MDSESKDAKRLRLEGNDIDKPRAGVLRLSDPLLAWICRFADTQEHCSVFAHVCTAFLRVAKLPASWHGGPIFFEAQNSALAATFAGLARYGCVGADVTVETQVPEDGDEDDYDGDFIESLVQLRMLSRLRLVSVDNPLDITLCTQLLDSPAVSTLTRLCLLDSEGADAHAVALIALLTNLQSLELGSSYGECEALTPKDLQPLCALPLRRLAVQGSLPPAALAAFADAGMPLTDLTLDRDAPPDGSSAVLARFSQLSVLRLHGKASSSWLTSVPNSLTVLVFNDLEIPGLFLHTSVVRERISGLSQLRCLRLVNMMACQPREVEQVAACVPAGLTAFELGVHFSGGSLSPLARRLSSLQRLALLTSSVQLSDVPAALAKCTSLTDLHLDLSWHRLHEFSQGGKQAIAKRMAALMDAVASLPKLRSLRLDAPPDKDETETLLAPLASHGALREVVLGASRYHSHQQALQYLYTLLPAARRVFTSSAVRVAVNSRVSEVDD